MNSYTFKTPEGDKIIISATNLASAHSKLEESYGVMPSGCILESTTDNKFTQYTN
jgi:hypothetical protein